MDKNNKKVKEKECVILFRYVKFQLRKLENNDKENKDFKLQLQQENNKFTAHLKRSF